MRGTVDNCTLFFSFSSPPIYPKPTPVCGVWSTSTEYTSMATDWQAAPFYNGSVAYSINSTSINVRIFAIVFLMTQHLVLAHSALTAQTWEDRHCGGSATASRAHRLGIYEWVGPWLEISATGPSWIMCISTLFSCFVIMCISQSPQPHDLSAC